MKNSFEKIMYNADELKLARFSYQYHFYYFDSVGHNQVAVVGQRNGVLYPSGDSFVDLISGIKVNKDSIIFQEQLLYENAILNIENIIRLYRAIEMEIGYVAHEQRKFCNKEIGNLYCCVPSELFFNASEVRYGLKEEFKKRVEVLMADNEPKCELDRLVQKVKSKFKRK